jgi:ABC-type phosphate/phosphonate transport system substrate-binding protein
MYDWPEVREATDAWWQGLRRHLGLGGDLVRHDDYMALWRAPDLVFSQTCGYPFTHAFKGTLSYLATPHYDVPGCHGACYSSFVLAREARPLAAFRGQVAAVNTPDSMSGMLALQLVFAPLAEAARFFSAAHLTGGHIHSMIAVRDGTADVCAVDAVAMALARRYRPDICAGLVTIAQSPTVPALPYVTRAGNVVRLRQGLTAAFADPALAEARNALFLSGCSVLPDKAYDSILALEAEMQSAGGLHLLDQP